MTRKCPLCGSENLEAGGIQSTGKVYLRLSKTKIMTLKTSDVELEAGLCMDCGYVLLFGDLEKARGLIKTKAE